MRWRGSARSWAIRSTSSILTPIAPISPTPIGWWRPCGRRTSPACRPRKRHVWSRSWRRSASTTRTRRWRRLASRRRTSASSRAGSALPRFERCWWSAERRRRRWTRLRTRQGSTSVPVRRKKWRSASWPRSSACGALPANQPRLSHLPTKPSETRERDPVCGMAVAVATARHRAEHAGRTYYFCCAGCRDRFLAAPERYAAAVVR